jgi:hypothetical protein
MRSSRAISIALFAALVAAPALAARAADTPSASASGSCTITADDLAAIQTAAQDGLLAELAARRALLSRTITCAENNTQALQSELNGLSVSGDARTIQSQLSGKLDDAITYYNLELAKVSGAGIAGTQAIAKEVLAWRTSNYEPLSENVQNFELWAGSQPLFSAAESRLNGIANLVAFFEQAGENLTLQGDLADAQSLVQTAKNEDQDAQNALAQSLPPDEVRAQIQQSLQTLSDTYQKFFDIASAIQSLLPGAK